MTHLSKHAFPRRSRRGFTLVEILVTIAIIGILAGIAIPAINGALRTANEAFIRNECANFATAIEAYRLKYEDYPPDFSDWDIVERHYRRVFPEILDSELILLYRLCDNLPDNDSNQVNLPVATRYTPAVMDRAEALVWAVGGFSSDAQRPFTGTGGPLALYPGAVDDPTNPNPALYQYNSERDNAFVDLDPGSLTLRSPSQNTINFANRTISTDELALEDTSVFSATQRTADVFPVYRYKEGHAPYVYFDSRTYSQTGLNMIIDYGHNDISRQPVQANGYVSQFDDGLSVIRPVYSNERNSQIGDGPFPSFAVASRAVKFVDEGKYQILAPGLDGVYGVVGDRDGGVPANPSVSVPDGLPVYWQYPTGRMVSPDETAANIQAFLIPSVSRFDSTGFNASLVEPYEVDNVGSFTNRTFGDDVE